MRKILFTLMVFSMMFSTLATALPVAAVDVTRVCGMDGNNYASADAAEAAGVDVSYNFACVDPASETGLYEAEGEVHFVGMLIEIGSTDVPMTIIVRPNSGGLDVTVNVTAETVMGQRRDQYTQLSDWIPGDQIRVIGKNNENTDVVDATILVNHSILSIGNMFAGANGWITAIDKVSKTVTYQWNNQEHRFTYDDNTRFVAAGKNPASVDDLEVNDRIRGRLLKRAGETPYAKIIVVLRRGNNLFMKIRTFRPNVVLVRLNSTVIPTTIQVKMLSTPGLKANDVNNLIGTEGALITVNINEYTKIVRKYFGETTLDEFSVGDSLHIVGRVNDDGTVDAKMVKNNSIWKTSTNGYAGVVTAVNEEEGNIIVNWAPYKHITKKRLKAEIQAADSTVTAQIIGDSGSQTGDNAGTSNTVMSVLRNRIQTVAATKIGQFTRSVVQKIVITGRIQHNGLQLKDLITRQVPKKIRVDITEDTEIIVGTNNNATISDIQTGDKVRIRGIKHVGLPIVTAETIVVVNSLPEIEESLEIEIDDINVIVDEIVTDDTGNAIAEETVTETEAAIVEEGETGVACTMDVKACPNGTFVSRIAPDCEFAVCPENICGNGVCEEGEQPSSCYYGTPACEMFMQGWCPEDCESPATCGNGICEEGEADECPSCYDEGCLAPCAAGSCPEDCENSTNDTEIDSYSCVDSDNGIEYFIKGGLITESTVDGMHSTGNYYDLCWNDGSVLHEWYCDERNWAAEEIYECPNGCLDGACIADNTASGTGTASNVQ